MKAIIMVAGVGSRLKKQVKHLPKCLLTFGGETILSRNIRLLRENNISEIIVVAGYRAALVREEIEGSATCVLNPYFRVTNSLASFWFAQRQVDLYDDLVIFNGDVIYEIDVLQRALDAPQPATMLIDSSVISLADYRLRNAADGGGGVDGRHLDFDVQRDQITKLAVKNRLPTIFSSRELTEAGGLMSYGQDLAEHYRRAATYVDKILKGAKPGDIPIEEPTSHELIVNARAAKSFGLTLPPSILIGADKLIE